MGFEEAIRWLVLYGFAALLLVGLAVWSVFRAEDPSRMVFKWVITLPVLGVLVFVVAPIVGRGGYGGAFIGIPFAAVCGLVLAIIWGPNLVELISTPFASLYTGGNVPPDPRPAYSVAIARQKSGKYLEAVAELRKQLHLFPQDLEGHLLLAAVQAENLGDLEAAEATIMHFCSQPGHAPRNLVFALYSLADWRLAIGKDREGAERALRKVIELLPNTEFELGAAQRIAHLGNPDTPLGGEHDKKYVVPDGIRNLGLLRQEALQGTEAEDKDALAHEYVNHLERHPHDNEVREKLAVLYLDHYGRMDLATMQLEDIINTPNQPHRTVAHCLNLLADLQVRAGSDYDTVKQTLERIIDLDPNLAAAETARRRLSLLKLELKARAGKEPVKLGVYEQNIGLTRARGKRNAE
jgi:tetratricopeptide (TPR) repeat protein